MKRAYLYKEIVETNEVVVHFGHAGTSNEARVAGTENG